MRGCWPAAGAWLELRARVSVPLHAAPPHRLPHRMVTEFQEQHPKRPEVEAASSLQPTTGTGTVLLPPCSLGQAVPGPDSKREGRNPPLSARNVKEFGEQRVFIILVKIFLKMQVIL